MLAMFLNTAATSQNTDAGGVWHRPFTCEGTRQNGFLHKGAWATLSGDSSLSADRWMI